MMTYMDEKERVRQQAIEYCNHCGEFSQYENEDMSYSELMFWTDYFYEMGKRYGLLREFRENGII